MLNDYNKTQKERKKGRKAGTVPMNIETQKKDEKRRKTGTVPLNIEALFIGTVPKLPCAGLIRRSNSIYHMCSGADQSGFSIIEIQNS